MKLLLTISYLGSAYCGYQVQNNGITVQGKMNEATEAVFGFPCDIVGCSRTDSGVHANMFCLTVAKRGSEELSCTVPPEKLPIALNHHLPHDIAVLSAEWVSSDFHPRYDVKYKEYIYQIWNGGTKNPFLHDRAHTPPLPITEEALAQMNLAARHFVGTHDFTSFMAAGSKITEATRTVYHARVTREKDMILFSVAADGFLYHMVRIMAGTLLEVARGKLAPEELSHILQTKDRHLAGPTAPACGLYLNRVSYTAYPQ